MAQRGARPKPPSVKAAAGNPGKRPLTVLVPPVVAGDMMCPDSVTSNPRAKGYWDLYLSNIGPGHLAPVDAPLLARLCIALAYADRATAELEATGMLVKAPHTGLPIQSPWMAIVNRQTEVARKLASELALPPAQRFRVGNHDAMGGKSGPNGDVWDDI